MPHIEYMENGVRYPSVTEVLSHEPKIWLDKWRAKWGILAVRKTAAANAIGTAFHDGAEKLSRRLDVNYPRNRRIGKMLERIEGWLDDEGFVPLHTELHVVSNLYMYHGTLDAIGTLSKYKGLVLIDYKSSSGIYDDMALQLAAYSQAFYEEHGIRITCGLIVHVSKDKPDHKLTVKEFKLTKTVLNKFLKRLKKCQQGQK